MWYLPNEIDHVLHHGLEHIHGLTRPGSGAADANCQTGPEAHVRVKRLCQ